MATDDRSKRPHLTRKGAAERARRETRAGAALRDNLKRRRAQTARRAPKPDAPEKN